MGDSNMSEYTIFLRNGVTALVLQMIEDGAVSQDFSLRDPVRAIKDVSQDVRCRLPIELMDGRKLTAVEMQGEFLELAQKYFLKYEATAEQKDLVKKWEYVLSKLAKEPRDLNREIDWVIKLSLIESFMDRKDLDWDSSQVQMLDLQYHDLRPEKGLYNLLERQGKVERIVTDEEIQTAIINPPEDTRAYFRGECLRKYGGQVFGVNWDSISFGIGEEPIKRVLMAEPLKGSKQHVEDLLKSSPTAADLVANLRT